MRFAAAGRRRSWRARAAMLALLLATPAVAEWLAPDPSYRDAQLMLRSALRDTVGRSGDAARLDTLGGALLALDRRDAARVAVARVRDLAPGDDAARAGLGKRALFDDRLGEAESLLAGPAATAADAAADLFATRVRRAEWAAAATIA